MDITPAEELLLARCVRKDLEALEALGITYGRPLYSFLFCAVGGNTEIARQILVKCLKSTLSSIEPFEETIPFLIKCLQFIDKALKKYPPDHHADDPIPADPHLKPNESSTLQALLALNVQERILLLLRDQLLLSLEEISQVLETKRKDLKEAINAVRFKMKSVRQEISNQ